MRISRKISTYTGHSKLFFENAVSTPIGELRAAGIGWKGDIDHWPHPDKLRSQDNFYSFVMLLPETQGTFSSSCGTYQISYGDFIVKIPHIKLRCAPEEGCTWSEMCVGFKGSTFDLLRDEGILNANNPVWHTDNIDYWHKRFEQLLQAPRPISPLSAAREVSQFTTFLLEILESSTSKVTNDISNDWFQKACVMLISDLSHKIDLRAIAEELGMSYGSFRRRFQQRAKTSPMKFRNERKCQVAHRRLEEPDISCWVIARYLGFYDEAHFSHTFKRWTGMTPQQYRNQIHNKGCRYP